MTPANERLAHRVAPGSELSLADIDPDEHGPFSGKNDVRAVAQLAKDLDRLVKLQEKLFAESRQSLLVVLQAPDTGGKDGVLRRVVGPLDSRGVHVAGFKVPTSAELAHDFLWRAHARTPAKGDMVFFNRSHYEDVLVVRVLGLVPKAVWRERFEHINAFEQLLAHAGTRVVKFYLHISRDEQKRRLEDRLKDPEKRWKFNPGDLPMRERWDDFQRAYEEALSRTSTEAAPWYVVPANAKWFRDLAIARVLVETLEDMNPRFPQPDFDWKKVRIR